MVSFRDNCYITKYEVTQNSFIVKDVIQCQDKPFCLAATRNSMVVGFNGKIEVWDLSGKFKNTLSVVKYQWRSFVTISSSGNIYHCDGNILICKSPNGKVLGNFSSPCLAGPHGIAVDALENVYVCGYKSNNICVFSPDNATVRILIKNVNPCGIFFDFTRTNFFLATENGGEFYNCKF